jgi:hypothetical protein
MARLSLSERRIRLRARKRRLMRDITMYGALYRDYWINKQLARWNEELRGVDYDLADVERQLAKAAE